MCLSKITKRHAKPLGERWAWKYFDYVIVDGQKQLEFAHKSLRHVFTVRRGKWLRATKITLGTVNDANVTYQSGFHACRTRRDAQALCSGLGRAIDGHAFVRVRVRGVHTTGLQCSIPVMVSREMFVPAPKPSRKRKASK